jgi:hypothetical protein
VKDHFENSDENHDQSRFGPDKLCMALIAWKVSGKNHAPASKKSKPRFFLSMNILRAKQSEAFG